MTRSAWCVLGLAGAAVALGAWRAVDPPRVEPPINPARIEASVTSFANGHPEWAVLREPRIDAAQIRLNHAKHLDPNAPGMQALLEAGADDPSLAAARLPDGRWSMTCASCHTTDEAGMYMRPISFAAHCARCHTDQLGTAPGGPGEEPRRSPHGEVELIRAIVERGLAARAALAESRFGAPAPTEQPAADAEQPTEERPSRRRRDSAGTSGSTAPAADGVPRFASPAEVTAWLEEERSALMRRMESNCGYCHETRQTPGEHSAGLFSIVPTRIPERWLTRSFFSHQSHEMLDCLACHTQARTSRATEDIMLPSIMTCRECHTPSAGAPSHCVECHVYHGPTPGASGGSLQISEFLGRPAGGR